MHTSYLICPTSAVLGLAAIAAGSAALANEPHHSCRLLDNEQRKCGFGFDSCDQSVIEWLEKQCLLDDGGTISWPPNVGSSW